jgi:hypothetical protein
MFAALIADRGHGFGRAAGDFGKILEKGIIKLHEVRGSMGEGTGQ